MSGIISGFPDFPRVNFSTLNFVGREFLLGFLFCFFSFLFFLIQDSNKRSSGYFSL